MSNASMEERPASTLFALAVELALRTAEVTPISKLPGCWSRRIVWGKYPYWLALNGHDEPKAFEGDGTKITVPPCTLGIIGNGWPLGFVDVDGGCLMDGGTPSTEAEIVAMLRAELTQAPAAGGVT